MASPVRTITESLVADDQELKALELEAMRLFTQGKNVRECGFYRNRTCKERACVICAERKSAVDAAKVKRAYARFRHAHLITLALPSEGLFVLGQTLVQLRNGLTIWFRRAAVGKVIRGAVGQIEPKLGNRRTVWACHAHLVVDSLVADPDFGEAGDVWDRLTSGRGSLLLPEGGSRVRSVEDAARYCTKRQDWCPDPGTMPLALHGHLLAGIKWRRRYVDWGTGKPAKEPRCRA
jgi:hypothetical protein